MNNTQSLFQNQLPPLADRLRPKTMDEFMGQNHLVGEGKILSSLSQGSRPFSCIFWGPPGTGKTTLARIISQDLGVNIIEMSAVTSGVKDLREAIQKGRANRDMGQVTVLFIDEIHRFSKSQQDALLHAVEEGVLVLLGATTENPSFEVISPLLSRSKVLVLKALDEKALSFILERGFKEDILLSSGKIKIPNDVKEKLIKTSGGDARKMLNTLEVCIALISGSGKISNEILVEALQNKTQIYDKSGDYHYDTISAFIKSVRGSDPDASIYWLAVMLEGGESPEFIGRRLIILASEDVGNADPAALGIAMNGFQAMHTVGMPEAAIILGQVTTYLASAPKSNASYLAIKSAQSMIKNNPTPGIPLHLRNAPTRLMKDEGYGKDYKYPHNESSHFVNENYFPEGESHLFYQPTGRGHESYIRKRLKHFWPDRYPATDDSKSQ